MGAALAGVFGLRATDMSDGPLTVSSPTRARGWFDGLTINTVTPQPTEELSRDGLVVYEYGALMPGRNMRRERTTIEDLAQADARAIRADRDAARVDTAVAGAATALRAGGREGLSSLTGNGVGRI